MFSNGIIIGIIVLVVLIVILAIVKSNRGRQQQAHSPPLETDSFNSLLESELSNGIANGIEGESLMEILGLENLPPDGQQEVIDAATGVIEKRCLNRILESLNEQEKRDFVDILDAETPEVVSNFLRSKQIDQRVILREEVLRFKRETAEKFS